MGILWFVTMTEDVRVAFRAGVVGCGASSVMPRKPFMFFKTALRHNPHTLHHLFKVYKFTEL